MQRWQSEFENHPIHSTIRSLRKSLDSDQSLDDPNAAAEHARILKIVNLTETVISGLDPDLAPIDSLNSIYNVLGSTVLTQMNNFASSGNASYITDAGQHISPVLIHVYQLSSLKLARSTRRADLDAATSSFDKFAKRLDHKVSETMAATRQISGIVKEKSESIEKIHQTVRDKEAEFDSRISDWAAKAQADQSQRAVEFTDALVKAKKDSADQLSAVRLEAEKELKQIHRDLSDDASSSLKELTDQVESIIQDAKGKHTEILSLYGLVGETSVSGGYKEVADREHSAAQVWRRITVLLILATLLWLFYSLLRLPPQLESERAFWTNIAKSVGITALLISFAIYASKQSNLHRANEGRMRTFFLQVKAFDPFIASLPVEVRNEMKRDLTTRMFGRDDVGSRHDHLADADFKGADHVVGMVERLWKVVKR